MFFTFLRPLVSYPKTLLAWVGVSLLIMAAHLALPRVYALDVTAALLTVIAAIYVGFALSDGRPEHILQESAAAALFVLLALGGLWLTPYLWPVGLFLHGVWDLLHHKQGIRTRVPPWYPPICVVVDWLLALFLLLWL